MSLEPPEASQGHRIRATTLAGVLTRFQTMVHYAFKSSTGFQELDEDALDVVVPAKPGSFQIILEASSMKDLFGGNKLSKAFEKIDMLFSDTSDIKNTLKTVHETHGQLADSYQKLIYFLDKKHTGIRYSWADPVSNTSHNHSISRAQVKELSRHLLTPEKHSNESIKIKGKLVRFTRKTGYWGLLSDDREYKGESKGDGPSLDGLKVNGNYIFECEKEYNYITGKPVLYLKNVTDWSESST